VLEPTPLTPIFTHILVLDIAGGFSLCVWSLNLAGFLRMNSKLGIVVAENLVMDNTKASTPQGKPESNMDGGASELSPLFCPAAPHVGQGTSHLFQPLALSKGGVAGNGAALKPIIPPVGSRWDDPPVRAKKRTKSGLPE
jgi:hypothetical protein